MMYSILCETALAMPHSTALVTGTNSIYTYQTLVQRVHQWAHYLVKQGVKAHHRIGLMTSDIDVHVFFYLAASCLKACYVPLDVDTPSATLDDGLKVLDLNFLFVTDTKNLNKSKAVLIADKDCDIFPLDSPIPNQIYDEKDWTYIMSTSGSTGPKKKWVPIEGAGLRYWADVEKKLLKLTPEDKVLSTRSPAFDAWISEVLRAFSSGATLYLMDNKDRKDMKKIILACHQFGITTMLMVPSQLESAQFNSYLPALKNVGLKHLLVTGEACNWPLVQLCKQIGIHLWDAYGPLQSTFGLSLLDVTTISSDKMDTKRPVPIAKPIAPMAYQIKDGKLFIVSPFLSPGYLNPDPANSDFIMSEGTRLFDTGDLFSEAGDLLYFEGRASFETHCKVDGVKVSPNHIEQIINEYSNGSLKAAVVVKTWLGHEKPIAYICAGEGFDKDDFLKYLKTKLTRTEMPVCFSINEFPRSVPSDKINKLSLIALQDDANNMLFKLQDSENITDAKLVEVLKLWRSLFKLTTLSSSQDFFDLGGDSGLSNQLVVMVQQYLDPDYLYKDFLSLSRFTPKAMAEQLTNKKPRGERMAVVSPLVICSESSKKAFFVAPLLGEGCFTFKNLAIHYAKTFKVSVYGISSPVLFDDLPLPETMEEEAEDFYKAMKAEQPEGPYTILGFSYGATLAYQVAALCIRRGDKIKKLELMDGFPPEVLKRMPIAAHTRLLFSMVQFIIDVLSKKPYNESLEFNLLRDKKSFEGALTFLAMELEVGKEKLGIITRAVDKDLLGKHSLIQKVFEVIRYKLKNSNSKRVLDLAERHLNFMLTQPEPSELVPIRPIVYQSKLSQDYWDMMDRIAHLTPRAPSRRYMFWNHYFPVIRKNGVKLDLSHLELLMKPSAKRVDRVDSFWLNEHDLLFTATDSYGLKTFYTCEQVGEDCVYNIHFVDPYYEKLIERYLRRLEIKFNKLHYNVNSELIKQEDSVYTSMSGIQFRVREALKFRIDPWLSSIKCPQKPKKTIKWTTLSIIEPLDALYITLMVNEKPFMDLSFDLPTFNKFQNQKIAIPDCFEKIDVPNRPGILFLMMIHMEYTKTIFDTIDQCSGIIGQFIAPFTEKLNETVPVLTSSMCFPK